MNYFILKPFKNHTYFFQLLYTVQVYPIWNFNDKLHWKEYFTHIHFDTKNII